MRSQNGITNKLVLIDLLANLIENPNQLQSITVNMKILMETMTGPKETAIKQNKTPIYNS